MSLREESTDQRGPLLLPAPASAALAVAQSGWHLPCAEWSAPPAGRETGQYSSSQNRQAGSAALAPRPQSVQQSGEVS